jgi:hypothetical protein
VPLRRFSRPGLLGSIDRDEVIAGTAGMTSRVLQHHPQHRGADQQAPAEGQRGTREQDQVGEAAFRSARASAPDLVSQLSKLADLRGSGVITEEEFRSAKTLLLTR